jgi:Spy/CpxP family protein refolding chaperone
MKTTAVVIGVVLCIGPGARAQQPNCNPGPNDPIYVVDGVRVAPSNCTAPGQPAADPFARYLFPPELIMAHQQAINLTDRQRSAIQEAMKESQGKFIDLQFRMTAETEKLQRLVQGTSVDEAKVLDEVDRVLAIEREVKRAQLTLMIRTKNQLTEQQQAVLNKLRGIPG